MKKIFFFTAIVFLTLSSCRKEAATFEKDQTKDKQSILATKSGQSFNSNDKKDRKILFVSNRDGNNEIYTMNIDGSNIVRLT